MSDLRHKIDSNRIELLNILRAELDYKMEKERLERKKQSDTLETIFNLSKHYNLKNLDYMLTDHFLICKRTDNSYLEYYYNLHRILVYNKEQVEQDDKIFNNANEAMNWIYNWNNFLPSKNEVYNQLLDRLVKENSVIKPEAIEQARKTLTDWFNHKDTQDLPQPSITIGVDDNCIIMDWEKDHLHLACYFQGQWPVEVAFSDAKNMKISILELKTIEELLCSVAKQVYDLFKN